MADRVFNICKGAVAEKVRDASTSVGLLLLVGAGTDDAMGDADTLTALLAVSGVVEATDGSYGRKTGLTGTITVDDTNNRVDVDLPDQTFTALAGTDITDGVIFIQESGSDSGRIPMCLVDFVIECDGSDVTMVFNSAGFFRAS